MARQRASDDLIGAIYEAALAPELWSQTLRRIATAYDARNAVLFFHDVARPEISFFAGADVDAAAARVYAEHYVKVDIWHPMLNGLQPGKAYLGHELVPDDIAARTEFYADFFSKLDLFHTFGGQPLRRDGQASQIGIQRSRKQPHFTRADAQSLQRLFQHLGRAKLIHMRMHDAGARSAVSAAALDRVPFGVVLTDAKGRVTMANRAALRLAESGQLRIAHNCLSATNEDDKLKLKAALSNAASSAIPRSQTIAIARGPGRAPLILAVMPASERLPFIGAGGAAVCVLIGDPDRRHSELTPALRDIFGLSPAEARLAVALTDGLTLEEVGVAHGSSRETVRSQLKAVFQKTGTNRQQDLLRLLLAIPSYPPNGG